MGRYAKKVRVDPNYSGPRPPQIHGDQRNRAEGNWTDKSRKSSPPQHILDRIAEETITGGYKRSDCCPICHVAKANEGGCWCD